jgi:uncharacterized protein (DUF433 family)
MSQETADMSAINLDSHIEITPGTCGGRPRIAGHRIRVQDVVIWHERMGLSADEIVTRYPELTLSDVFAALAYYHDHLKEIDGQMVGDGHLVDEMRRLYPSKTKAKLSANE